MNEFKKNKYTTDDGEVVTPTIMNRIAPGYADDEIAILARYFAAKPKPANRTDDDPPAR